MTSDKTTDDLTLKIETMGADAPEIEFVARIMGEQMQAISQVIGRDSVSSACLMLDALVLGLANLDRAAAQDFLTGTAAAIGQEAHVEMSRADTTRRDAVRRIYHAAESRAAAMNGAVQ